MTEHRIRFRMGWEIPHEKTAEPIKNVSLPTSWPEPLEGKVRLIRRFGRPRSNSSAETYRIEIRHAPGLLGVRLNGQPVEVEPAGNVDLLERNMLELEVDLNQIPRQSPPESWGNVALVIRSDD